MAELHWSGQSLIVAVCSFCSFMRMCVTNFIHCLLPKSLWRIWQIVYCLVCNWSLISFRAIQQSVVNISCTFATVPGFWALDCRLLLGLFTRSSHPCLNVLNNSGTCIQDRTLFPLTFSSISCVPVAVFPVKLDVWSLLPKNKWHTVLLCTNWLS